jgi:16S rRNA (cytosine1402-N4)-methyltransferase
MRCAMSHKPVMLQEVLAALAPKDGQIIVDGTFGRGGYTRAFLEAAQCEVWGIDRDPEAVTAGRELEKTCGRFHILEGTFGQMDEVLSENNIHTIDSIALDLGISSPQIDQAERGFSFAKDGPLDMRMSQKGPTAADLVNTLPEEELADIIYNYGEERASRRIAKRIVAMRRENPITTTKQLAEIIYSVLPRHGKGIDPATRTFQALRIKVNDEMGELERGLEVAERLLQPGGRLAVVSFHSLEDRCVKQFLRSRSELKSSSGNRHMPESNEVKPLPTFKLGSRKAIKPSDEECKENPRARSAKLRWAVRTDAPQIGGMR